MATNMGYFGPAAVPVGPMPADIPNPGLAIADPYHGSPQAVAAGQRLFTGMNCASCHGYKGVGGMGPALNDDYWRYGGTPVEIYKSIYEGRPKGMPAWGVALPADQLWALTSYVASLGGASPPEGAGAPGTNSGSGKPPQPSKSAAGHTFPDELSPDEKRAVLEYLKTL